MFSAMTKQDNKNYDEPEYSQIEVMVIRFLATHHSIALAWLFIVSYHHPKSQLGQSH
jgi:hypothetical protein